MLQLLTTLFSLFMLLAPLECRSEDDVQALPHNHARMLFQLIDAHGNATPGGRVRRTEWVWSKATPADPVESPALRVWLTTSFPSDWRVEKITGKAVTVVEEFQP
ncbi:MAG: hypothetical protein HY075_08690, partial [Deltaproteobacteria bacterium]|nr:hypothetical protein [Deltaproteobacteria bacterium]